MSEVIQTCSGADPAATLKALTISGEAFMFLERVPSQWLESVEVNNGICLAAFDPAINWNLWERGRVFCQGWELRWEGRLAVYTGAAVQLPGFLPGPDLSACTPRELSYYLWGQRDGNQFIELQVARVLTYPVAAERVKLRVVEWFDSVGQLVASRCLKLEAP